MNLSRSRKSSLRAHQRGLSLIELMIALLLGMLVVGAAIGIFLTNKKTYTATESLGRVQENVRTAFELMAHDVRAAAGNSCVNNLPLVNVISTPTSRWWTDLTTWGDAVEGFAGNEEFPDGVQFGTATGTRLAGTGALQLMAGDDNVTTIKSHNTSSAQFVVNTTAPGYSAGDLLMACNSSQASLFQASSVSSDTIGYAASGTPGNCTTGLGLPFSCGTGTAYQFASPTSVLVRVHPVRWYIGTNARNGKSLYQVRVQNSGGTLSTISEEVAEGVTDLQVSYLLTDAASYADSVAANNWGNVISMRITVGLEGQEKIGTDGQPIKRQLVHVVSLRNRNA